MVKRKCYDHNTGPDGKLVINPDEVAIGCWIFNCSLSSSGLGKLPLDLEVPGIPTPTSKFRWSQEVSGKLLANEKTQVKRFFGKALSLVALK